MDPLKDFLVPRIRKRLRKDWDCWSLKTGEEGSGKSSEGIYYGHYISGNDGFRIRDNIVYEPDDFLNAVFNAKKYDTVLLDEGGEAWYNRDFATRINKCLAKAAMQVRERNLNVTICVPRWHYLDNVVLYRHKFRTHIHDIRDVRGFCEYYETKWDPFSRSEIPFWDEQFRYRFPKLPTTILETYREIKRKKGEERLIEYIEVIRKEREKITGDAENKKSPPIIVEEIRKKNAKTKYLNERGKIDWHKVQYFYQCNRDDAQQVAAILNSNL
jgi:hypothetical protein